jgi:hypothetical protein
MIDPTFPWIWLAWLLVIGASFAVIEGIAIARGTTTLSRFTVTCTAAFPPLIWIIGVVCGGLAVHFWWHWCPVGVPGQGG